MMEEQADQLQQSTSRKKEADDKQAAELKELSERLFQYSMKDQWEKVVAAYKENPKSQGAKITDAEDTALHLAVSGGKLEIVDKMVEIVGSDALKAKNKRGNTPLHVAAALGNARMCHRVASKYPNLIAERNNKNETPFFLAAQFGHADAFLCLYFCFRENHSDICRDASGNTILHAAIAGEHFDLAFQIICKYPKLVDAVNVNGLSPLHVLATKINAFKSCSRLGLLDRILYHCIIVDEMKDTKYDSKDYLKRFEENYKGDDRPWFPQNYETCEHFFRMLPGVACFGTSKICCFGGSDEENPQGITSKITEASQAKPEPNNSTDSAKGSSETGNGTNPKAKQDGEEKSDPTEEHKYHSLPPNYATFIQSFKFVMKLLLVVLGLGYKCYMCMNIKCFPTFESYDIAGFQRINKMKKKKQRHRWASEVMNKLIDNTSMYKYGGNTGSGNGGMAEGFPWNPTLMMSSSHQDNGEKFINKQGEFQIEGEKKGNDATVEKFLGEYQITGTVDSKTSKHALQMKFERKLGSETKISETPSPILIAASKGITEMVDKILEKFPVAIQDVDAENKNAILLAVENRQPHTFQFLMERKNLHEIVFRHWDNQGNSALHLAATYGHYRPWLIPGSALQMQWELKWYKFVKKSMAKRLLVYYNMKGQTPKQIFTETHKSLVKDGSEWLTKTSESCSLIAVLIATVAFATATNIPGGFSQKTGKAVLRDEPAFGVFAISSLVALCFSVTALVFFLAILTSRFEEKDFAKNLPRRLILGLTSLFTSIAAMLFSFCAGHFFVLEDKLKVAALPIYTATCLPISFFALAQLPLYFDLLWAIFKEVPQRSFKEFTS